MAKPDFSLAFSPFPHSLRRWVQLVVATLAISGIAPLILLLGRGSFLAEHETIKSLFHNALVIHVDLSVLAWFLGISLLFWGLCGHGRATPLPGLRGGALGCFAAGALAIATAPLFQDGVALMSNYIPVHTSGLFFLGLSLLLAAVVLGMVDIAVARSPATTPEAKLQRFGIYGSVYITALAIAHFVWAYFRVTESGVTPGTQDYYELLFWAGGHILQFAVTQLLLVAWLWLASGGHMPLKAPRWVLYLILAFYPLSATTGIIAFLDGSEPYNLYFYTIHMRHAGGFAALFLGAYLTFACLRSHKERTPDGKLARTCLLVSIFVFATGGILGYLIGDSNTIIPAHYHGSIVGCTVAFMGVIYLLLPHTGWTNVGAWKTARLQPWLYGGGSVMHAVGFAIAGGHGAQRKTVGAMEAAPQAAETAMQLARFGGALAVLGGALFIIVVIRSARRARFTAS